MLLTKCWRSPRRAPALYFKSLFPFVSLFLHFCFSLPSFSFYSLSCFLAGLLLSVCLVMMNSLHGHSDSTVSLTPWLQMTKNLFPHPVMITLGCTIEKLILGTAADSAQLAWHWEGFWQFAHLSTPWSWFLSLLFIVLLPFLSGASLYWRCPRVFRVREFKGDEKKRMERVWTKDGKAEEYSLVVYPAQCDPLVEVLCWPLRLGLGLLLLGT